MTPRPVFTVLHTRIGVGQFPFVERRLLAGAFLAGVLVLAVTGWLSLGALTFVIGYAFAWWTRDDPTFLTMILRAMRTRTHYDAAAYRPVSVTLTGR